MSGGYAPSNGKTTMFSALPAEWQLTGQPNGADNVFNGWGCGAGGDPAGLKYFVHGGGHFDSSNNGLHVYDFTGSSVPTGWSQETNSLSALDDVILDASDGLYADGNMTAIHAYGACWFDAVNNRFVRVSGSPFSGGGGATPIYGYFNLTAHTQSHFSSANVACLGSALIGKPDGTKYLYLNATGTPQFINASTFALTASGSALTGSEEKGPVFLYDSLRDLYMGFYDSGAASMFEIAVNWAANTFTKTTRTLTGADADYLDAPGACCLYDAANDQYVVFGNKNDATAGEITNLYKVNASNYAVTKSALSQPIEISTSSAGGYNKHVWFPSWRIIGTCQRHDKPMSLIKV